MPRANLKLSKRDDLYLQDTRVENLFISEYLPSAPEGYIKVYLFGLMYAQNNMSLDTAKLSRVLRISEDDLLQALKYWASAGLVKFEKSVDDSEYNITYVSQIELMYANNLQNNNTQQPENVPDSAEETEDEAVAKVVNMEVNALLRKYEELTGRLLSSEDSWKIHETIKTYDILPDVMSYAMDFCISEDRLSINQIVKTAVTWAKEGCHNLVDVKEYIDKHSKRNQHYKMVFHEMGWNRMPAPGDCEMMDRWFDELGYSIKEVLDACRAAAGLRDPSLKYVNKVLENKKLQAGGINTAPQRVSYGLQASTSDRPQAMVSKKVLKDYYDYIRLEGEKQQDARIDEVCSKIVEIRDLFDQENELNRNFMAMTLSAGREQKDVLRNKRRELENEKQSLLVEHGYSKDYLERRYRCDVCKDTGITNDGRICACSEARAKEAYKWNLERNQ
ncbi:MAG: DnaD domain protein [Clostridiales bacterium]|nr:DnaD domain protein [Candidatus Crickella equi]